MKDKIKNKTGPLNRSEQSKRRRRELVVASRSYTLLVHQKWCWLVFRLDRTGDSSDSEEQWVEVERGDRSSCLPADASGCRKPKIPPTAGRFLRPDLTHPGASLSPSPPAWPKSTRRAESQPDGPPQSTTAPHRRHRRTTTDP